MGLFNALNKFLNENIPTGPEVSGPDSFINYYSPVTSDLKDDDEYLSELSDGVRANGEKRPLDVYLQAILDRCGGVVQHATVSYLESNNDHYAVWELIFTSGHKIKMRFRTESARQLTRGGESLRVGYWIEANYAKKIKEVSRREETEREKRRQRPVLESFLGVKFDCPVGFYAHTENESHDMGNGLIMVEANVNHFMSFDVRYVVKPFDAENVIGVMCVARVETKDAAQLYMQKVAAILEEKYQRPCKKCDDGSFEMHFYHDECSEKDEYAGILLLAKTDGSVILHAVDTKNWEDATARFQAAAALKSRQQEEIARRDALAAL